MKKLNMRSIFWVELLMEITGLCRDVCAIIIQYRNALFSERINSLKLYPIYDRHEFVEGDHTRMKNPFDTMNFYSRIQHLRESNRIRTPLFIKYVVYNSYHKIDYSEAKRELIDSLIELIRYIKQSEQMVFRQIGYKLCDNAPITSDERIAIDRFLKKYEYSWTGLDYK